MGNKCPKCGAKSGFTDVTGTYDAKSGAAGAGVGALLGGLLLGPVGLLAGAGLGAVSGKSDSTSRKKEYKCSSCGKRFYICPNCMNNLETIKYNNFPSKSGYRIIEGKKCRNCEYIITFPSYQLMYNKPKNNNEDYSGYNDYDYDDYDDYDDDDYDYYDDDDDDDYDY